MNVFFPHYILSIALGFHLILILQPSACSRTHTHRIPDHNELMMADSQCRICGIILSSQRVRRNHEITIHRLTIINGETFSRNPYVMPLVTPSTPGPAVTTQSPLVQTASSSASSIMTLAVQTPLGSVSPTIISPALTGSSGSASIGAPTLFLTPSPGSQTSRRSAASASPVGRNVRPRASSRSASVTPGLPSGHHSSRSPNDPGNRTCKFCLREYYSHAEMNRHLRLNRCIFQYRPENHNMADYCVLKRPPNYNQTAAILSQLTISDKIQMCRLNSWAIPGLWPLVFPGQHLRQRGQTPIILAEMTASRESTIILRSLLRTDPQVVLPKQIIVKDEESDILSVLPTEVLTPGSSFETRIAGDQLLVSSGNDLFSE